MNRTDAIRQAEQNHNVTGGRWHVVELNGEFWDVSDYWLQASNAYKKMDEIKPVYSVGVVESTTVVKKLSVARKLIFRFNMFLLWLTKRLRDARADNRKT